MCPFCIATAALVTASAVGTGGLSLLVTGKLMKRAAAKDLSEIMNTKEVENGHNDDGPKAF